MEQLPVENVPLMQAMQMNPLRPGGGASHDERSEGSGFLPWHPTPEAADSPFHIVGSEFSQVLEVALRPGEVVTAEPRSMLFVSEGVTLGADAGGLDQALKRGCCAGESFFRLHLEHGGRSQTLEKVALTPSFPAKIVPVDLRLYDGLVFNRGAFLAALGRDWRVNVKMVQGLGACCCAGQGLFLNTLHGNGMVFLNAGGTVLTKQLAPGERVVVDKHAVLAFERSVTIGIRAVGSVMACCCGGQGLFNAELTGPGLVWVHTMSLARLRQAVGANRKSGGNTAGSS